MQPIAENAVHHGIQNKKGGGTITLATREHADCFEISIVDNGIGFDIQHDTKPNERTSIGISNVRARLQLQCGGKLIIQSEKGVGTTVVIQIPKGGMFDENNNN